MLDDFCNSSVHLRNYCYRYSYFTVMFPIILIGYSSCGIRSKPIAYVWARFIRATCYTCVVIKCWILILVKLIKKERLKRLNRFKCQNTLGFNVPCTYQSIRGVTVSLKLSMLLPELPLVLFDCQFENVSWIYDQGTLVWSDLWSRYYRLIRSTLITVL